MKKTLSIIIVSALIALMCAPFAVTAFQAVGNVNLNYGSVAVDGNFSADKWAAASAFTVDESNSVAWAGDITATFTVFGLWDEAGLYLGGEVNDSTFMYSDSGYSGDSVQFSLGLGQFFQGTGESRCIFYSFGCYEDPSEQILVRQESENNGDVADGEDGFILKTKKSANGWTYEMLMPWSMLNFDLNEKLGKTFAPEPGGKIDVLICYLDHNDDGLGAWGTFTSEEPDWGPEGHGLVYVLQAKPAPEPEPEPEPEAAPEQPEETPAPAPAPEALADPAPAPAAPATGDSLAVMLIISVLAAVCLSLSKKKKAVER